MNISRRRFAELSAYALASLSFARVHAVEAALHKAGLKDLFREDFLMGVLTRPEMFMQLNPMLTDLIAREFNSIVAENAFKWLYIHPTRDHWDWSYADEFVAFGEKYQLHRVGHVLVWDSQLPLSLFKGSSGQPVTRDVILARMDEHIRTVVGRYKGRMHAWDVVNEAFDENGWVQNRWYRYAGKDYVASAFRAAHEADPSAVLLYNDYGLGTPKKQAVVLEALKKLLAEGVPIGAIGMQGHFGLDSPDLNSFDEGISAFAELGLRVHITELDVDVLPPLAADEFPDYQAELDPYRNGMPDEVSEQLANRYADIFRVLLKHRDVIDRVTFWGFGDGESWKNDFPIQGRVNYPVLFDRAYQPKSAYYAVSDLKK